MLGPHPHLDRVGDAGLDVAAAVPFGEVALGVAFDGTYALVPLVAAVVPVRLLQAQRRENDRILLHAIILLSDHVRDRLGVS